jgi:hypothetical protein
MEIEEKELQQKEFRFIPLYKYTEMDDDNKSKGKTPIETNWPNHNYRYDDPRIKNHEGNIGAVLGPGSLGCVDVDDSKLIQQADKVFKKHYISKTGGGGRHIFFKYSGNFKQNYYVLKDKNNKAVGELRINNCQVLIPGSIHPNGNKYESLNNNKIQTITQKELYELITELGLTIPNVINSVMITLPVINEQREVNKKYIEKHILPNLSNVEKALITGKDIIKKGERSERDAKVMTHLLLKGFGEYIQSIFKLYPVGDKYREHNASDKYLQTTIKSARTYSGIADDKAIVLEDEINNLSPRILRGKLDTYLSRIGELQNWSQQEFLIKKCAIKTGISHREIKIKYQQIKSSRDIAYKKKSMRDLYKTELKKFDYWIDNLLVKGTVNLIGGTAESFKSMMNLVQIMSMLSGKPYLDKFKVIQTPPKILLYDLESGDNILTRRLYYLMNNANLPEECLENCDYKENFNSNDIEAEIKESMKYDIIYLDPYRYFLQGDENKSEVTNKFFNEYIKKMKMADKTINIVHHFKKTIIENFTDVEVRDAMRGSSDIVAQFDSIIGMFKTDDIFDEENNKTTFDVFVKFCKNRIGAPFRDYSFQVIRDDNTNGTILNFTGYKKRPSSPKTKSKELLMTYVEKNCKISGAVKRGDIISYLEETRNLSARTIDSYLGELVKSGELRKDKDGEYQLPIVGQFIAKAPPTSKNITLEESKDISKKEQQKL